MILAFWFILPFTGSGLCFHDIIVSSFSRCLWGYRSVFYQHVNRSSPYRPVSHLSRLLAASTYSTPCITPYLLCDHLEWKMHQRWRNTNNIQDIKGTDRIIHSFLINRRKIFQNPWHRYCVLCRESSDLSVRLAASLYWRLIYKDNTLLHCSPYDSYDDHLLSVYPTIPHPKWKRNAPALSRWICPLLHVAAIWSPIQGKTSQAAYCLRIWVRGTYSDWWLFGRGSL